MNKHYEPEFKKKIVRLHLEKGRSLKSLATEYGISNAYFQSLVYQLFFELRSSTDVFTLESSDSVRKYSNK